MDGFGVVFFRLVSEMRRKRLTPLLKRSTISFPICEWDGIQHSFIVSVVEESISDGVAVRKSEVLIESRTVSKL